MRRLLLAMALVGCAYDPREEPGVVAPPPLLAPADRAAYVVWRALQIHAWTYLQDIDAPVVTYRERTPGCGRGFMSSVGCVGGFVSYPPEGMLVEVLREDRPSEPGYLAHELCHAFNAVGGQPDNGQHISHCFKDLNGNVPWASEANEALRAAGY